MKKILFACAIAATFAACTSAPKTAYVINGVAGEGVEDGATVVLKGPLANDTLAVTEVVNGAFTFEGNADSTMTAYAMIDRQHVAQIYIEPGTITANLGERTATGTPLNDAYNEYSKAINALYENEDLETSEYVALMKETYLKNADNLLGVDIWNDMLYDLSYDEMSELLETAQPQIKNDRRNERMLNAKLAAKNTAAGAKFIDFEGITVDIKNAKNDGKPTTLGAVVAQGKPVIVDFWASWCGPCRREINEYLSQFAPEYAGKVNFVGVAVWENSVDDTKKAMGELPISWPVIFAGDRNQGPTNDYGIMGIPHIMLIGADGTIVARDLRGNKIKAAIDSIL